MPKHLPIADSGLKFGALILSIQNIKLYGKFCLFLSLCGIISTINEPNWIIISLVKS